MQQLTHSHSFLELILRMEVSASEGQTVSPCVLLSFQCSSTKSSWAPVSYLALVQSQGYQPDTCCCINGYVKLGGVKQPPSSSARKFCEWIIQTGPRKDGGIVLIPRPRETQTSEKWDLLKASFLTCLVPGLILLENWTEPCPLTGLCIHVWPCAQLFTA